MLEQEKITQNAKKYFETSTKLGFMNDELMTFLGTEFISAPASSSKEYHNCFEGGLIDHLLNVAKYAVILNKALPEVDRVEQDSLLKVCLLHQIGKAKLYKPQISEWHRNKGMLYSFNNDLVSMRVSERSIYYATSLGIKLTESEFSAIIFFDKNDDKMSDYHNSVLGELLKSASVFAIKNELKRNG